MQAIERFERRRKARRRVLLAAVAGVFCAAGAAAYFAFPAEAESVIRIATATIARSWSGASGSPTSFGGATYMIDLTGGDDEDIGSGAMDEEAAVAGEGDATSTDPLVEETDATVNVAVAIDAAADPADTVEEAPRSSTAAEAPLIPPAPAPAPTSSPPRQPCDLGAASSRTPIRGVLINEVAWMGSAPLAGETASKAANREWIELRNMSNAAVDISGWQIEDGAGKLDIVLGTTADGDIGSANIPAHGFYLLERGGGPATSGTLPGVQAEEGYSGTLPNSGGALVLFDAFCGVEDRLDASDGWPAGDNADKRTMERNEDGYGWHTSAAAGGTPSAENSSPSPPAAAASAAPAATTASTTAAAHENATSTEELADGAASTTLETASSSPPAAATTTVCYVVEATSTVSTDATTTMDVATTTPPAGSVSHPVIAEVQIAGDASGNDFVKIFNPSAVAVDMAGWKLRKRSKSGAEYSLRVFPEGSGIAPGGYFTWANADDGFGDAMGADVTSTATLAADNSVALLDADGAIVDAVAWGEGTGQYAEGAAYPANPDVSQVLKRKFADGAVVDTGNNADDFAL